jgi:hypothetical protein
MSGWAPVTPDFWSSLSPKAARRIRSTVSRMRVRLKRRIGVYAARDARLLVQMREGRPVFALIGKDAP